MPSSNSINSTTPFCTTPDAWASLTLVRNAQATAKRRGLGLFNQQVCAKKTAAGRRICLRLKIIHVNHMDNPATSYRGVSRFLA